MMFLIESLLSRMLMISMNGTLVVSYKLTQWNSSMILNNVMMYLVIFRKTSWTDQGIVPANWIETHQV